MNFTAFNDPQTFSWSPQDEFYSLIIPLLFILQQKLNCFTSFFNIDIKAEHYKLSLSVDFRNKHTESDIILNCRMRNRCIVSRIKLPWFYFGASNEDLAQVVQHQYLCLLPSPPSFSLSLTLNQLVFPPFELQSCPSSSCSPTVPCWSSKTSVSKKDGTVNVPGPLGLFTRALTLN